MSNPVTAQPKAAVSVDAAFINAFLKGTLHTLKIQCSYELKAGKSTVFQPSMELPADICGVIGLTSSVFKGAIILCFPKGIFLDVMGSMFGETFPEVTDELSDGAGELLNIIFGTAKTMLTNDGYSVEKAIPTIVRGDKLKVSSLTGGGTTIMVPFEGKSGVFHVLISLGKGQTELKAVKS